jgi:hypothetical protein
MSIINDALKKLQNQISHSAPQASDLNTSLAQEELSPAQKAGFQPIDIQSRETELPKIQNSSSEPQMESHLVIILGVLCLMIGLFVPIVNKESVIFVVLKKASIQIKQMQQSKSAISIPMKKNSAQPAEQARIVTPAVATPVPAAKQEPVQTIVRNNPSPAAKKTAKPQSRIIINGIMNKGEQNLALIDGQIYVEGDEVDGVKLLKIAPKGVTVLEDGEERTIKVMGL